MPTLHRRQPIPAIKKQAQRLLSGLWNFSHHGSSPRCPFEKAMIGNKKSFNSKGVALLQALFLLVLISALVIQINFEVDVEYTANSQALHKLRAYRAAKASLQMSLLRIKIYNKVMTEFGSKLGDMADMAKMIYELPFSWPLALPSEASGVDKDATIVSEDLLNINDLDSPSKNQRTRIQEKIIELINNRKEFDEEWADRNKGLEAQTVVNNIKDWIDPDTEGANGGSEASLYGDLRDFDSTVKDFPPNRFFRTMDEVRMVSGVTDDIYDVLKPAFSVFGPMGINPNFADEGALKSLHKGMTDEVISKIMNRRNDPKEGGSFKDADDFFSYINSVGGLIPDADKDAIPLRFTNPCHFRVTATGSSGKTAVTITAVTYDISCANNEVSDQINKERQQDQQANQGDGSNPNGQGTNTQTNGGSSKKQPLPKGPPRIVYWNEK